MGQSTEEIGKPADKPSAMPKVVALSAADIRACIKLGFADFRRAPIPGLAIAAIFVIIGASIVLGLTALDMPYMAYPFAIGFPLIGPFAAAGLYETSRRLENGGEVPTIGEIVASMWAQRRRELSWMAFVMLFVFWVWMYQVRLLIALFLGLVAFASFDAFLEVIVTTEQGWMFLVVGHIVGAVLALILFSITVVAMPLLMDRDLDIVTAMITSVKAVVASPVVMLGWGAIVTLTVIAACVPFFLGLYIVLPVLGHATWHLYRRAVVPAS
jgi:uncharacterized membrane protein